MKRIIRHYTAYVLSHFLFLKNAILGKKLKVNLLTSTNRIVIRNTWIEIEWKAKGCNLIYIEGFGYISPFKGRIHHWCTKNKNIKIIFWGSKVKKAYSFQHYVCEGAIAKTIDEGSIQMHSIALKKAPNISSSLEMTLHFNPVKTDIPSISTRFPEPIF